MQLAFAHTHATTRPPSCQLPRLSRPVAPACVCQDKSFNQSVPYVCSGPSAEQLGSPCQLRMRMHGVQLEQPLKR